jgi:hypothetical protein
MVTYAFTSTSLARQRLRLIGQNRVAAEAEVLELLASLVTNDSSVAGATVKEALNNLLAGIAAATPWDHVVKSLSDLPSPAGGFIDLTTGSWAIAADLDITPSVLRVPSTETVLVKGFNKTIRIGIAGSRVLEVDGTALIESLSFDSENGDVIYLNSATSELQLQNCTVFNGDDGTSCINLHSGAYFRMFGGELINVPTAGAPGLVITGNFTDVLLDGVRISGCAQGVLLGAGTVGACSILGCRCESNCVNAIQWASGSIPTQGLVVVGNRFNLAAASCFNGFTPASARVNCKANLYNAGLLTETAIVP